MRLTNEELNKIKKDNNVDTLWSWSRLEKARTSLYEFYLAYIKHVPEDRTDCVYGVMGGLCHDVLEKLYNNELSYDEMGTNFESNWAVAIDISDLKFDRNDSEKNRSIAAKYKENLTHFFEHHKVIPYKVATERFILTKFTDEIIFQGYIDGVFKDNNGCYNIIDFKTSTKYSPSVQKEKCGQLVCYALGLNQMGVPLDKINIAWNFLKYVRVLYKQANGTWKNREIERREIGKSLVAPVKVWLKKLGYEDDINRYVDEMVLNNSIESLPDDVKEMFIFDDCYVGVDLTQDLIDYWTGIVVNTVNNINDKIKKYDVEVLTNPNEADKIFYDTQEAIEKESYYYATLSGYSANLNKPYKIYLEKLEQKKNGIISYDGLGSELDDDELEEIVKDTKIVENSTKDNVNSVSDNDDIDLSWLDEV